MSVYVDPLMPCKMRRGWPYPEACHLTADTLGQLHQFAMALGMKAAWYQDRLDMPHYDLTSTMRALAVEAGAVEITAEDAIRRLQAARAKRIEGGR